MTMQRSQNQLSRIEKRNQRLFDEMLKLGSFEPKLTFAKLIAFTIALLVHSLTALFVGGAFTSFVVAAISLVSGNRSTAFALVFVGAVLAVIGWLFAPRLGRWPSNTLVRTDFPALYRCSDRIALAIGAKPIEGIVFTSDYNASFARVGFRRKSLMSLGVPLWAILTEQERVALIGHELAHGVNQDSTRGLVLGSAFNALLSWNQIAARIMSIRTVLSLFAFPIYYLTLGLLNVLYRLLFHESRRAEYLADALGAQAAGTEATISMLNKLQFSHDFSAYLHRAAEMKGASDKLFEHFRTHVDRILSSPDEFVKVLRERQNLDARYSLTHPPLEHRKAMLKARAIAQPKFTVTGETLNQLRRELDPSIDHLQAELVELVRSPIHG